MIIIRRLCRFIIIKYRFVKRNFLLFINFKIVKIKTMFINFNNNNNVLKTNIKIKIKIKIKNFFICLAFRYSKISNCCRQSLTLNHETRLIFNRFIDFRNRIMFKLIIIDNYINKNISKNINKTIFNIAIFNRNNELIIKKNMIKKITSTKNIKKNTTNKKQKKQKSKQKKIYQIDINNKQKHYNVFFNFEKTQNYFVNTFNKQTYRYICRRCFVEFYSNNKFYKHVRDCKITSSKSISNVIKQNTNVFYVNVVQFDVASNNHSNLNFRS